MSVVALARVGGLLGAVLLNGVSAASEPAQRLAHSLRGGVSNGSDSATTGLIDHSEMLTPMTADVERVHLKVPPGAVTEVEQRYATMLKLSRTATLRHELAALPKTIAEASTVLEF